MVAVSWIPASLSAVFRAGYPILLAVIHLSQELVRCFFWQLALKETVERKVGRVVRPRVSTVSVVSLTREENI